MDNHIKLFDKESCLERIPFTGDSGIQVVADDIRRRRGLLWHRPDVFDDLDLLVQGHSRVSPSIATPINGKEKTP
jgi:hypothetical protein